MSSRSLTRRRLPPPPLLLFLASLLTLYRHRRALTARFQKLTENFGRLSHALHLLSNAFSQTSLEVHHYLHPSRRRPNTAPVPRSVRRLLRLAATPDALCVLQNVAGGVASGVTREMKQGGQRVDVGDIVDALARPQGQTVIKCVVSTAVREAVFAFGELQAAREPMPIAHVVMDKLTSDKGRQLAVDVATGVARTVVPLLSRSEEIPSALTVSPVASPARRKRPMSMKESAVSKQVVLSMMQAKGGGGLIERLALLAIRDKQLVKEVVRAVVAEAVRTYLVTKAELGDRGERKGLWGMLMDGAVKDLKQMLTRGDGNVGWVVF